VPDLVVQEQTSGPDLVVVTLRSLNVAAGTTLRVTGSRPVVLAVFGDATIAGTIDVSASGTAGGPGNNWECNLNDAVNGTGAQTPGGGGGGGGGLGANGGRGGNGDGGSQGGQSGIARGTAALTPLLPGCRGGWGGGCGDPPGGGGGALQLAVTGQLQITGSLLSRGASGVDGCGIKGGASGGGSGGAILLQANQVTVGGGATLSASGGTGGRGANGGNGGVGSATGAGQAGSAAPTAGGGGGGGSAGRIRITGASSCSLAGNVSPVASTSCP
jgi:hypothetical protein